MKILTRFVSAPLVHALVLMASACGDETSEPERVVDFHDDGGTARTDAGEGTTGGTSMGGESPTGDGGTPSGGAGGESGGQPSGGSGAAGGASTGGEGGAGSGGDSSGAGSGGESPSGGSGGSGSCEPIRMAPHDARSASFSGTDSDYGELYNLPCSDAPDCVAPCEMLGGTEWFCEAHICIDSEPDYCLPPTKWRSVASALAPGTTTADAAVTSLGTSNGTMQDRLILEDFDFNLPAGATILGIEVEVRRAGDASTTVIDYAVQLVKAGDEVGSNYATTTTWNPSLETVHYGGAQDLWGESWTPEDINDEQFGVAIGALPSGGGRAYIDIAYITVHTACP